MLGKTTLGVALLEGADTRPHARVLSGDMPGLTNNLDANVPTGMWVSGFDSVNWQSS